jgi:hypothetical protein
VFLNGINGSEGCENVEDDRRDHPRSHTTNEDVEKCGIWCIQTVNQAYYVEIIKQLHEGVHRKRPELWPNNWILHHNNVLAH